MDVLMILEIFVGLLFVKCGMFCVRSIVNKLSFCSSLDDVNIYWGINDF